LRTFEQVANVKGAGFAGRKDDETAIWGEVDIGNKSPFLGRSEGIANTLLGYLPNLETFYLKTEGTKFRKTELTRTR